MQKALRISARRAKTTLARMHCLKVTEEKTNEMKKKLIAKRRSFINVGKLTMNMRTKRFAPWTRILEMQLFVGPSVGLIHEVDWNTIE